MNNELFPTLVALMAVPAAVWIGAFAAVRSRFHRRVCAVLYATALSLPVVFIALLIRIGVAAPFY